MMISVVQPAGRACNAPGFERMVSGGFALGKVGAVLRPAKVSRFARNSRDIGSNSSRCVALVDTVLVDQKTIYAPTRQTTPACCCSDYQGASLNEYELDLFCASAPRSRAPLREGRAGGASWFVGQHPSAS